MFRLSKFYIDGNMTQKAVLFRIALHGLSKAAEVGLWLNTAPQWWVAIFLHCDHILQKCWQQAGLKCDIWHTLQEHINHIGGLYYIIFFRPHNL